MAKAMTHFERLDLKFMPLLFVNLAGEMIYILNQRLQAQNFESTKSEKILVDLVQAMFDKKFVDELYKLQNIYARESLKIFFQKFVHCSIMRLTENSMDKLYDLMVMAVKYQVETCINPIHIISISLNHIDGIKKILPQNTEAFGLLKCMHHKLLTTYANISVLEKALLRSSMLSFFQGARVRISSFLREKKQLVNGHFVLFPTRWIEIASDVDVPGRIRYYTYDTNEEKIIAEDKFSTNTKDYTYIKNITEIDYNWQGEERGTGLGENIFQAPEHIDVYKTNKLTKADTLEMQEEGDELKFLTKLIAQPDEGDNPEFELNLFNDTDEGANADKLIAESNARNERRIDARCHTDISKEIAKLDLSDNDQPVSASRGAEMLTLLDEVSKETPSPNKTSKLVLRSVSRN